MQEGEMDVVMVGLPPSELLQEEKHILLMLEASPSVMGHDVLVMPLVYAQFCLIEWLE